MSFVEMSATFKLISNETTARKKTRLGISSHIWSSCHDFCPDTKTEKDFKNEPTPASFNKYRKLVGRRIQTLIVGVEGEDADHNTSTTPKDFVLIYFTSSISFKKDFKIRDSVNEF